MRWGYRLRAFIAFTTGGIMPDALPEAGGACPGGSVSVRARIIVLAKVPRAGQVKTRLARALGDMQALAAYRELLRRTLDTVAALKDVERELCIAGDDEARECEMLADALGFSLTRQQEGHLGERMAHALRRSLDEAKPALLVGADCPILETTDFVQALDVFDEHDAVFLPTLDGGYALVGAARRLPPVFEGIAWSTDQVMSQTEQALRAAGHSYRLLRRVWDVDDYDDWVRWRALKN